MMSRAALRGIHAEIVSMGDEAPFVFVVVAEERDLNRLPLWARMLPEEGEEDDDLEEVGDEEIEALRAEAGADGDMEMVRICDLALEGDEDARAECVWVLSEWDDDEEEEEDLD